MKHIRLIAALLILLLAAAALLACNGDTPTESTPSDTTAEGNGAATEAPTEAPADKVEVTLTVKDQDGNPMAEAVLTVLPASGEGESATLTADGEGTVKVSLPEGEYTVRFDVLPEYVLGMDTTITVTAGMAPVTLEVTDNTPNGSEERPFVINEDSLTVTVPAGVTYHFTLFGGYNRTLHVTDAGAEILFRDETYTPDENGSIAVRIVTDSPRDHAYVALTNKSGDTREITLTLVSDPGAMDNPIAIEKPGETLTAKVPQDGMVYYKWTATETGTITVLSSDAINNISINNLTTSQVSDFSGGAESVSLNVSEGDEITVVVSVIGGDKQAAYNEVRFKLILGDGEPESLTVDLQNAAISSSLPLFEAPFTTADKDTCVDDLVDMFGDPAIEDGVKIPLIYQGALHLGSIDLSKYSKVTVTYATSASPATIADYETTKKRAMLVNTDTKGDLSPFDEFVVASAIYTIPATTWMLTTVEIDLTNVDYSGDVYLTFDFTDGVNLYHAVTGVVFEG